MGITGNRYPEIDNIHNFIKTNEVIIRYSKTSTLQNGLIPLTLSLKNSEHQIYVMDEYDDLRFNNPLLNAVLVFQELEIIEDSTDYLNWCKQQSIQANNEVLRVYYMNMITTLPNIARYFPNNTITSFVSGLDFQLNAGAAQRLRSRSNPK